MNLCLCFEIEEEPKLRNVMEELVENVGNAVQMAMGPQKENYNIVIASDSLIQKLNNDFRKKDSVTDVLSFPLGSDEEVTGEIYVCWSRVVTQAENYGHSWQREFCFLLVHGILHLLGYEHGDEPSPEMRGMEEKILKLMEMGR